MQELRSANHKEKKTYQVTLDALKLSPCYPAFLITAEVPEVYMHQFWNTIQKIKDTDAYQFKLDKKKFRVDTEVFRKILQICPRLPNQAFVVPPSEELVTFIQELSYSGKCDMLSVIHTDQMHQPWRTFVAIINREISSARKEHMPYPRFTKVIINHFIYKEKTISMRNMINLHTICDDSLLGTLKFVSKTQDYQQYGALIPDDMINQDIKDSKAYKTYYDFATGKATPKKARKYKKVASPSRKSSPVLEEEHAKKPERARNLPRSLQLYHSRCTLLKAAQVKEALQKSKKDSHMIHASGLGGGFGSQPKGDSGDDESNDDDNDEVTKDDDEDDVESDANKDKEASDSEKMDSDEDENLNVNQNDDEEEEHEEEYVRTPDSFEFNDDDEEYDELYKDVNVRSKVAEHEEVGKGDAEMTDTTHESASQEKSYDQFIEDAHVTLTSSQILKVQSKALLFHLTFTRIGFATQIALQSYTAEFEKKAQAKKEKYIDIIEKSVKEQLPRILPKEISDFATPVIRITINVSLENVVLAKSYSQPQSTYETATSLTEFELKKILLDKLEKMYSLKGGREDKDEDPPAGSDKWLKKRKTSKDDEPSRGSKSKESKLSSCKGSKSQSKSSGKSAQAEELVFETVDTEMPQDQVDNLGNAEDQPKVKEDSKHDWFKKPKRPPNPDRDWNAGKQIDSRPPQTWISKIAKVGKPPTTFDELMSTPIDFLAYVLHNLKIENLTQEHLVGPAFNILKGTCKSRVELKFHFEECYKAVTDKLDWMNPKGHEYPFDLIKPLPLVEDQGRQVVPANYFFNNDLEYLKGGSLSSKYTTSTTKTKAAKYDTIEGIEDMVPSLWSPMKKKLSNLEKDNLFYLNVALWMFIRRVVIPKRVKDLQLGVESYQKKINITRPETFRLMRFDELYKFCDGTLSSIRIFLHNIASSLEMDYLPKRR
ncbi:hypothetical protein Tco_0951865 [Tanacetum coccineum]|uniref:Uncharacterized protein n=1 Tax=Tanacetum coccineum TaxID=301880 RepID=A0ABQ5DVQ3_9ASTR